MAERYYVGVDVGTGSVRAALVRPNGEILKISTCPIQTWNPQPDHYEQSSDDIWRSACQVVKAVTNSVEPKSIKGLGFDATCSLVCLGRNDQPLTISATGRHEQNIILWMDHRARKETEYINERKPDVLKFLGGKISPEMQTPKLMWLKRNLRGTWNEAKHFFDLVDFLTWKATGDESRSLCTLVCKWTYVASEKGDSGWDANYFSLVGLEDLLKDNAAKIGSRVKMPGESCGAGLTKVAAKELGLLPGTYVGTGLIDAPAGGLGLLTSSAPGIDKSTDTKIGLICGTSTCHMIVSQSPKMVPGVWGPYYCAMVPKAFLTEAGQSAAGKLIDFVVEKHPAYSQVESKVRDGTNVYEYLNKVLVKLADAQNLPSVSRLTSKLHMWPDFHGNRSPLADPSLQGMISGLSLSSDENDLAVKYLATVQALAYGSRHIIDTLLHHGYSRISTVLMCGGLSKNPLFAQVHADVLGLPILVPETPEPVLLGAALLGTVAAGEWKDVDDALANMSGPSHVFRPRESEREYHLRKYKVFLRMVEDQKSYEAIMSGKKES